MKNTFTTLIILLSTISFSIGQVLISYDHVRDFTPAQVDSVIGESGPNGVSLYTVVYTLLDHNGLLDTVSGLVCLPLNQTFESNVVIYNHGTSNDPQDVPSTFRSGYAESLAFASFGFSVGAPDYLGEGVSETFHPYIHAETEALAGLYLIDHVLTLTGIAGVDAGPELFVAGYSQGGHASMALQKMIETEFPTDYNLTAVAHGSGPFSISHVMRELIAYEVPYLPTGFVPYFIIGYQEAYGNVYDNLEEIFKPSFVPVIQQFEAGDIGITELSTQIGFILFSQLTPVAPKFILQDSILTKLEVNDPNDRIIKLLRENDVYNFRAQVPTRLYYCEADDVVPFENSIFADSAMQQLGATDLQLVHVNPAGSHGQCAVEAIPMAIDFFLSFINVGVEDYDATLVNAIYPNPAHESLTIELLQTNIETDITIQSINGQSIFSTKLTGGVSTVDISSFVEGIYFLTLRQKSGAQVVRFIKQ